MLMYFEWQFLPRKTAVILLPAIRFFVAKLFLITCMYRTEVRRYTYDCRKSAARYRQVSEELYWLDYVD